MFNTVRKKKSLFTIAISAIIVMVICDIVLLATPVSGWYYDIASFGAARNMPTYRAAIGAYLGAVASFFTISAYSYLEIQFNHIDYERPKIMSTAFIGMAFFNGVFHAGYFFLCGVISDDVFEKYCWYLIALSSISGIFMCVGTWHYISLLKSWNCQKRYYLINPITTCLATLCIFTLLPAPIGGLVKPTFINIGLLVWLFGFNKYVVKHQLPWKTETKYQ